MGFFEYVERLLLLGTWGLSDSDYPQTVQHFVLAALPPSFCKFSAAFPALLGTLGTLMLFMARKRELEKDFSKISAYLRMDAKRIGRQALLAALPGQALLWSILAPIAFAAMLLAEAKLEIQGLGMLIGAAFSQNDLPLLYGGLFCASAFALAASLFFLLLKTTLPGK